MNETLNLSSEAARKAWSETVDAAYAEKKIVVLHRYNRPIVTMIAHNRWEKMKKKLERLEELEMLLLHRTNKKEMEENPEMVVTGADFAKMLVAAGLEA